MKLESLNNELNELCREVGSFIAAQQDGLSAKDIGTKGLHDYVTHVDMESERRLVDGLKTLFPGSGFLAEENTIENRDKPYTWIIDPLDGTTNFIHQLPTYSISVALEHRDQIIMGTVLDIRADECYTAIKDCPASMNGRLIQVSDRQELGESLLATGFPYNDFTVQEAYVGVLSYLMRKTRGIRRFGSAAIDLAWVASGKFDGFWEYSLKPWDVAAGSFIVKQAGGVVSDFHGASNYLYGKEIVCGNTAIHPQVLKVIKQYFK